MNLYSVTRSEETLEHHGVKGQKWGVRRYKQLRKEGVKAKRTETDARKIRKLEIDSYRRSANRAESFKARQAIANENGNSKKAKKMSEKFNKHGQKAKAKARSIEQLNKTIAKNQRRYRDLINEAAKTPVHIIDTTGAKHFATNVINKYIDQTTPGQRHIGKDSFKTGNDSFDNDVIRKKQKY